MHKIIQQKNYSISKNIFQAAQYLVSHGIETTTITTTTTTQYIQVSVVEYGYVGNFVEAISHILTHIYSKCRNNSHIIAENNNEMKCYYCRRHNLFKNSCLGCCMVLEGRGVDVLKI